MRLAAFYQFNKGNKTLQKHLDVLEKSILNNKKTPTSTVKFFAGLYFGHKDYDFEKQDKGILFDILSNKPYISIQAEIFMDDDESSHVVEMDDMYNNCDSVSFNIS